MEELGGGRVGFYRQSRNVGHVANFNTCLERSRGELVHLLHGDDCVRDGFYAALERPFVQHENIGAAFCRHIYVDDAGHWETIARLHEEAPGRFERAAERLLALWPVQPPAMVVRRAAYEQLGGFDSRVGVAGEDVEMWVRIAAEYPVWYEPEALALYRIRPGSLIASSMRSGRNVRDARRTVSLMRERVPSERRGTAVRAARARCAEWALKNASMMVARGDVRGAAAQTREALMSDPMASARSLALTGVRHLADAGVETLQLPPTAEPRPKPSSDRPVIGRVVGGGGRPLWSVMIPTYECAGYLRETLASVLAQDPGRERMQIEVVDDASSDGPEAVVEELGGGRVGFYRQSRNVGHVGELQHLLGALARRAGSSAARRRLRAGRVLRGAGTALRPAREHRGGLLPLHRVGRARPLEERCAAGATIAGRRPGMARADRGRPATPDPVHGRSPRGL